MGGAEGSAALGGGPDEAVGGSVFACKELAPVGGPFAPSAPVEAEEAEFVLCIFAVGFCAGPGPVGGMVRDSGSHGVAVDITESVEDVASFQGT